MASAKTSSWGRLGASSCHSDDILIDSHCKTVFMVFARVVCNIDESPFKVGVDLGSAIFDGGLQVIT